MTTVRCPKCGLVAAFGTAEQRFNEIKRHRCQELRHPAFAWTQPTTDGAA
jgi:phage FluMu protein Com